MTSISCPPPNNAFCHPRDSAPHSINPRDAALALGSAVPKHRTPMGRWRFVPRELTAAPPDCVSRSRVNVAGEAVRKSFTYGQNMAGNIAFALCHPMADFNDVGRIYACKSFATGRFVASPLAAGMAVAVGLGTLVNPDDAGYRRAKRESRRLACWDGKYARKYSGDSPTLIRFKCSALLVGAPLLFPVTTLVNMVLLGAAAGIALYRGQWRQGAKVFGCLLLAPLGAVGLIVLAAGGLVRPLESRNIYAMIERRTRPMPTAPCFQPLNGPQAIWDVLGEAFEPPEHGLGGIALDADGTAKI